MPISINLVVDLYRSMDRSILVRLLNARVKISRIIIIGSLLWRKSFTHLVPLQGGNVVEADLSVLTPLGLDSLVKQTEDHELPACKLETYASRT